MRLCVSQMTTEGFIGPSKFHSCFHGDQNIPVLLLLYFEEICAEHIFLKDSGIFNVVDVCLGCLSPHFNEWNLWPMDQKPEINCVNIQNDQFYYLTDIRDLARYIFSSLMGSEGSFSLIKSENFTALIKLLVYLLNLFLQ